MRAFFMGHVLVCGDLQQIGKALVKSAGPQTAPANKSHIELGRRNTQIQRLINHAHERVFCCLKYKYAIKLLHLNSNPVLYVRL